MICDNLTVQNGTLYFNGASCATLTETYGSGLYVMDEDRILASNVTYRYPEADYVLLSESGCRSVPL